MKFLSGWARPFPSGPSRELNTERKRESLEVQCIGIYTDHRIEGLGYGSTFP